MIQRKFEDFQRSVVAKAERFSEVDNFAKRLVAEGHTDTVIIKEQQDILRWVTLLSSWSRHAIRWEKERVPLPDQTKLFKD